MSATDNTTPAAQEIEDPLAGCFDYQPGTPLTGPGTECGFLEVPVRRKDGSGFYTYLQCKYRHLADGKYVYCKFRPRIDHFKNGRHEHKIPERQRRLEELMTGATDNPLQEIAASPCPDFYDALAHFAASANISLEHAICPQIFNVIWTAANWCLRNASNPAFANMPARHIFRRVSRRTLRALIIRTADHLLADKLRILSQQTYVSVILDAGTVRHNHWLDFIIKSGSLEVPFGSHLIDNLDTAGYCEQAITLLGKLERHGIQVSTFVGDGLPCQVHALNGRHVECFQKRRNLPNPQWQRIIFSPCWVHRVQLVYKHVYKKSQRDGTRFAGVIDALHQIASKLRKPDGRKALGRVCPAPVETRWLYIYDVAKYIYEASKCVHRFLTNRDDAALADNIGDCVHILQLLEPLRSLTNELSASDVRLGQVFPLVRAAYDRLRELQFPEDKPIYSTARDELADELLAVTIRSYEGPYLVTAYLLTPEGKAEYSPSTMSSVPTTKTTLPQIFRPAAAEEETDGTSQVRSPDTDSATEEEEAPEQQEEPEIEPSADIQIAAGQALYLHDKAKLHRWGRMGMDQFSENMRYPKDRAVQQFLAYLTTDITQIPNWEVLTSGRHEMIWSLIMTEALPDWQYLARVAERIASIPASEVSCERSFSLRGYIQNKRNERSGEDLLQARLVHIMVPPALRQ